MIFQRFSNRQKLAMLWWNQPRFKDRDVIICDGSIRSGKTISMTIGFILWSMSSYNGEVFGICGKTVESLRRNIILNLRDWIPPEFSIKENRTENKITITDCTGTQNTYFIFGGKDESSYTLIQGITLAGILLDEVVLMPCSFVEQAVARCSVAGSKMWFNCNPGGPEHWFYKEWVLQAKERNALHIHFTMEDNLALEPAIRDRYMRMYSGVFYRRYILGEWCIAEGLVYDCFGEDNIVDDIPKGGEYYISIDYGTLNPFSAGLWCVLGDKATRIREYYYNGRERQKQLTDEQYCDAVEDLANSIKTKNAAGQLVGPSVRKIVVDPSAASFITALRNRGYPVIKADNDVLDGIRKTAEYIRGGNIKIHRSCTDCITEFGLYCWNDKAAEDAVIKEHDHAMDDTRYFAYTILKHKAGRAPYQPLWVMN